MSKNEKLVAVSNNGKRWRIVPKDDDWEMVVTGHVTAGRAEAICRRIAGADAALTAAEARIKALSEALEPFAIYADWLDVNYEDHDDDIIVAGPLGSNMTFGDFRRARQALSTLGGNADDR